MANEKMEKPDFSKIWGENGNVTYKFSDDNYLKGWGFVGNIPPARGMFDAYFQGTDKKLKWLDNALGDYVNRDYTIDDTKNPTDNKDTLPNLLSGMANMIKTTNGTDDWKKPSATSLKDLSDQIASNNLYHAEATGYGIVSGCEPSINGLTVTVSAGVIHTADGRRVEVPEQSITLDAADATKPRTDVVYLDKNGAIAKIAGELGTAAVAGKNTYTITTNFAAGDTIAFDGVTFKCTDSTTHATALYFTLGSDIATSVANFVAALNPVEEKYVSTASEAVITITEKEGGTGNTPGNMVITGTGVVENGTATSSCFKFSVAPEIPDLCFSVTNVLINSGASDGILQKVKNVKELGSAIINVKDFGAACDGVTDDTAAVQAAITYAEKNIKENGVSSEILMPGLSLISESLQITNSGIDSDRYILHFFGPGGFVLPSNTYLFKRKDTQSGFVGNLWFHEIYFKSTEGNNAVIMQGYPIIRCRFDHCSIINVDSVIYKPLSQYHNIEKNFVQSIRITNCDIIGGEKAIIRSASGEDIYISNCLIENRKGGVFEQLGDNTLTYQHANGIYIDGCCIEGVSATLVETYAVQKLEITRCIFESNKQILHIKANSNNKEINISNNHFISTSFTAGDTTAPVAYCKIDGEAGTTKAHFNNNYFRSVPLLDISDVTLKSYSGSMAREGAPFRFRNNVYQYANTNYDSITSGTITLKVFGLIYGNAPLLVTDKIPFAIIDADIAFKGTESTSQTSIYMINSMIYFHKYLFEQTVAANAEVSKTLEFPFNIDRAIVSLRITGDPLATSFVIGNSTMTQITIHAANTKSTSIYTGVVLDGCLALNSFLNA